VSHSESVTYFVTHSVSRLIMNDNFDIEFVKINIINMIFILIDDGSDESDSDSE